MKETDFAFSRKFGSNFIQVCFPWFYVVCLVLCFLGCSDLFLDQADQSSV